MGIYILVKNTAMNQIVSFERESFASIQELGEYLNRLQREYGQIGGHEVRAFLEIWPNGDAKEREEEIDEEEEFDADELEEEE